MPIPLKRFVVVKIEGTTSARLVAQFDTLREAEVFAHKLPFDTRILDGEEMVKEVRGRRVEGGRPRARFGRGGEDVDPG